MSRAGSQRTLGTCRTHSSSGDHRSRKLNEIRVDWLGNAGFAKIFDGPFKLFGNRFRRCRRKPVFRAFPCPATARPARARRRENTSNFRRRSEIRVARAPVLPRLRTVTLQLLQQPQDRRACIAPRLAPYGPRSTRLRQLAQRREPHQPASRRSWGPGHNARPRAQRPARRGCPAPFGSLGLSWIDS